MIFLKKKKSKILLSILFVFGLFFIFTMVDASSFQEGVSQAAKETGHDSDTSFFADSDNIPASLGKFIKIFYIWILGIVFFFLVIYAGIVWMTARGNEEKIEKAKSILKNALIGIAIAMMAYVISLFAFGVLAGISFK